MSGINKAFIVGNLGADPELKLLPGGGAVLKLRIATDEVWIDKENKKQEKTEWHRVTVFGRRAEGLAKFVRKGMKLCIDGRLQTSTYDKDGQKHYSTEIIANDVVVAGSPRGAGEASAGAGAGADAPFAPYTPSSSNGGFSRSPSSPPLADIPF